VNWETAWSLPVTFFSNGCGGELRLEARRIKEKGERGTRGWIYSVRYR
jgi:hypothetical protein